MARTPGAPASPRPRSLLPREHGAYAEMAFPQVTALVLGGFSAGSLAFCVLILGAFLSHEPALVLLRHRGERLHRQEGARARRRVLWLGVGLVVDAFLWFTLAPPAARGAVLLLIPLALALVWLVSRKREKGLAGEMLVALFFALASVPTALSGNASPDAAFAVAEVWAAGLVLVTLAVRAVITRFKHRRHGPSIVVGLLATVALAVAVRSFLASEADRALLGLAPPAAVVLAVMAAGLKPRHLRVMGWLAVAANLVTFLILVGAVG